MEEFHSNLVLSWRSLEIGESHTLCEEMEQMCFIWIVNVDVELPMTLSVLPALSEGSPSAQTSMASPPRKRRAVMPHPPGSPLLETAHNRTAGRENGAASHVIGTALIFHLPGYYSAFVCWKT